MKTMMIAALLFLSACVPLGEDRVEPAPEDGTCPAPGLGHLVGHPVAAFDFDTLAAPVRILPPGAMMTMDHIPERLNVDLDDAGSILRLWCG